MSNDTTCVDTRAAEIAQLRAQFPITNRAIYMNHAATGPIPLSVQYAMLRQLEIHGLNVDSSSEQYETCYQETRRGIARLVGGDAQRVAFVQNTSHGISILANGQDWREGDNVVIPALEFPSNCLPWLRLESLGVELRRMEINHGRTTAEELAKVIDNRTRVVALSSVQYFNGFRCDLAKISAVAQAAGALLIVDGTQSVGALEINVEASGIDALVVSAHKWMCGPLGIGFVVFSKKMLERTEVTQLGWLSVKEPFAFRRELDLLDNAARFEPGTENAAGIFGLHQRLIDIESFGASTMERRVIGLTDRLADALLEKQFHITSPMESEARSGILTFRHPDLVGRETVDALASDDVFLSFREGSIRASPHYYNTEDEIDELVDRLSFRF